LTRNTCVNPNGLRLGNCRSETGSCGEAYTATGPATADATALTPRGRPPTSAPSGSTPSALEASDAIAVVAPVAPAEATAERDPPGRQTGASRADWCPAAAAAGACRTLPQPAATSAATSAASIIKAETVRRRENIGRR